MALTLSAKARARWVWATGMMVVSPTLGRYRLTEANQTRPTSECGPDLTDEVTAACLPMVVRAAFDSPLSWCAYEPWCGQWAAHLYFGCGGRCFRGSTEAEAWIAALEAAP